MTTTYKTKLDLGGGVALSHWMTLPIDEDPFKSKAMWQGATFAKDPVTKKLYLFQAQANPTGPGDIEDTWIHVYEIDKVTPIFQYSMLIKEAGHVQSFHVRISAKGRPWIWFGAELFDKRHRTQGYSVYRALVRRGRIYLNSENVQLICTGEGSAQVVGLRQDSYKNATIVLRRPTGSTETYEWHSETILKAWKPGKIRPKPYARMVVLKSGGTYQSACAIGDYLMAKVGNGLIYRINGATDQRTTVRCFKLLAPNALGVTGRKGVILDITNYAPAEALPVTSEEGEGIFVGPTGICVSKRANSTRRRSVFIGRISGLQYKF